MLYENKEEIGGFANNFYWSSTENDYGNAWNQFFFDGDQFYYLKANANFVRSVRAS